MASVAVKAAVDRSGIDPKEVDDCIMGAAIQQGTQGFNLGRQVAMASGLPVSVAGMTIDRQCSSGLMTIATGAKHIINDNAPITIAGGCESISLVQNEHMNSHRIGDPLTIKNAPMIHMPMLDTAETVAKRYNISREAQDEHAVASQDRTADAQVRGAFDDEIVPVTAIKMIMNKETGEVTKEEVTLTKDEGNRPGTTIENLANLNLSEMMELSLQETHLATFRRCGSCCYDGGKTC